jgi:hypothetical protein
MIFAAQHGQPSGQQHTQFIMQCMPVFQSHPVLWKPSTVFSLSRVSLDCDPHHQ